jgi:hypothetical protein
MRSPGILSRQPRPLEMASEDDKAKQEMPLHTLLKVFGMTFKELEPDLISGKLVASGSQMKGGGYIDIRFSRPAVEQWMAETGRKPIKLQTKH